MISQGASYRKTSKGNDAIASRQHGLPPRLRTLLIVVDGKKSGEDLLKFAGNLGDAEAMMKDLLEGEFIEPVPGSDRKEPAKAAAAEPPRPPAEPESAAPAPAALPQRPALSLPEAKRLAVRRLTDLMGPMADELCIGIESAKNPEQFMNAVRRAQHMIQSVRGKSAAASFGDEMEASLT